MLLEDEDTAVTEIPGKEHRWYQLYAVNRVNAALENGRKRIHIKGPTQTGKTFTAALVLDNAHFRRLIGVTGNRPVKVLWIAHKHRLLTQAKREMAAFPSIDMQPQSAFSPISTSFDWDVAIIDECHHEAMMSIQHRLVQLTHKPILGLTATD